jgi:hypothetical protein
MRPLCTVVVVALFFVRAVLLSGVEGRRFDASSAKAMSPSCAHGMNMCCGTLLHLLRRETLPKVITACDGIVQYEVVHKV